MTTDKKPLRTSSITQFLTKNNHLASHDPKRKIYKCNESLENAQIEFSEDFIAVTIEKPLPVRLKEIERLFFAINKSNESTNFNVVYDVNNHSIMVSTKSANLFTDSSGLLTNVKVTSMLANDLAKLQIPRHYNSDAFQTFIEQTMINASKTEEALPNKPSLIM